LHQFDFGSGNLVRYFEIYGMTPNSDLPVSGSSNYSFTSYVYLQYSSDSGANWQAYGPTGNVSMKVTYVSSSGGTNYYTTELLSLSVSGGGSPLPANIVIRESPTKATTGRLAVDGTGVVSGYHFRA